MRDSLYYSQRSGKKDPKINLELLKELFLNLYNYFFDNEYFIEYFGYCSDDPGNFGNWYAGSYGNNEDISRNIFLKLRKKKLWPINQFINDYTEEDLFDMIEFCYDHISKPIYNITNDPFLGYSRTFECYDYDLGKNEFRKKINFHLNDYDVGYELNCEGFIVKLAGYGLEYIYNANIPSDDKINIINPIIYAVQKFRNRNSKLLDRKDAIRKLVDVLEYLKPRISKIITKKDESDLFNIANNFGIRHHNTKQKNDYDENIWLSWMFYYYLSSLHALLRLIEKDDKNKKS